MLWKIHIVLALIFSFVISNIKVGGIDYAVWAAWFLVMLPVTTCLFAIFPQIMFKNSERILTVDSRGWSTQIGNKSGSRTWAQVESIEENAHSVIITGTNNNALIIPEFAFADSPTKQQFVADIKQWKEAYVG
jgi:hypothetical protein